MALRVLVIHRPLIPPRQRKGVLRRPRLETCVAQVLDYPLALVQAGTGFGKRTKLTVLADAVDPFFWFTITELGRDSLLFLAHAACAFERGEPALGALDETGERVTPEALTPFAQRPDAGVGRMRPAQ